MVQLLTLSPYLRRRRRDVLSQEGPMSANTTMHPPMNEMRLMVTSVYNRTASFVFPKDRNFPRRSQHVGSKDVHTHANIGGPIRQV